MNVLPPDVIRILSFHGPVEVWAEEVMPLVKETCPIVPFEETSYLLAARDGPLAQALLENCSLAVHARHPDGEYSLRLVGRAHAGLVLTKHPEKQSLMVWVPEDRPATAFLAVPFVADRIELTREEAGEKVRYFGPTPAGRQRPSTGAALVRAGWGGAAIPLVAFAFVVPWVWLGIQGAEYRARPAALVLSIIAGLAQIGAARLLVLNIAFRRWREGRARSRDAPVLRDALLAPGQARKWGVILLGTALILPAILVTFWDREIALVALAANGGWLLGPASLLHLSSGRPEPKT